MHIPGTLLSLLIMGRVVRVRVCIGGIVQVATPLPKSKPIKQLNYGGVRDLVLILRLILFFISVIILM